MSPIVRQKEEKFTIPSKYLLFLLSSICILLMMFTYGSSAFDGPFNSAAGYIIVPFENGISRIGEWLGYRSSEFQRIEDLLAENEELKDKIAQLTEENAILSEERYELTRLQELLSLSNEYEEYRKVGARIIAKDSSNWFQSFIIDKGSDDGLEKDMNVLASGGLVGRISEVGPNWSRVTSIISDDTYVSASILSTGDTLIVRGGLELLQDGYVSFSQLIDGEDKAAEGDKVVTSQISDKYLPNLLIGYINNINRDNNNLTKSGTITPVVDFEHLTEVLVITDKKNTSFNNSTK